MLSLKRKRELAEFGRTVSDPFLAPPEGYIFTREFLWVSVALIAASLIGTVILLWP